MLHLQTIWRNTASVATSSYLRKIHMTWRSILLSSWNGLCKNYHDEGGKRKSGILAYLNSLHKWQRKQTRNFFLSLSLKQRKGKLVMWPARFNYRRFSVSVPSQTTHWLIYNWDHSITLRYNYRPSASSKLDYEDSHLQVKFFSISIP